MSTEQICIDVKLFASAREVAGVSSCKVMLSSSDTSILNAIEHLLIQFPNLSESINEISIAVNKVYITQKDYILKDGDVVALIPPISGG